MSDELAGVIPMDVWYGWVEAACAINEYSPPAPPDSGGEGRDRGPPSEDAPGSDFNRRGSWAEAGLLDAGWFWARKSGEDRGLLCRPGKDHGVSASAGLVTSKENGWPLFYCWSTNGDPFVPESPYTRFGVFALLRHAGDHSAAAKELVSRGYGKPTPQPEIILPNGKGPPGDTPDAPDPRVFRWMSELRFRPENDKWLWHGYLSRGGVTLINALWKAGKSTLLAHLVRAFDGRSEEFLGRAITPSRVLYVSEEHEELWAERRDELNIGDHVGIVTRDRLPFRGRSSPAEWAAFIGKVAAAVASHRFDVVIFDTISKLWPVREENDAGQVEDALMPLWAITNAGAALGLVHHNRKSGGQQFTGARGSGGLPAFCETLIEFDRNSPDHRDRKRLLTGVGRYRETPGKWLIELLPHGYVSHGDPGDGPVIILPDPNDWRGLVAALLPEGGAGLTVDEVQARLRPARGGEGVRNKDLIAELNRKVEGGEFQVLGLGTNKSPYRYFRVGLGAVPGVPPPGMGREPQLGTD